MIEEELKQEAEKSLDKRLGTYAYIRKQDCYTNYVDGYIDSAEPREKRIAELEAEVKEWKDKADLWCKTANLKDHNIMINKELQKELDYQKQARSIAENAVVDLTKENAELKEELKKWKDEWQEQVQKATDEGYARTLQTIQLTKAKEIIKYLLSFIQKENYKTRWDINIAEAEQFIKDSEVEK
jgi:hypothetical protein